MRRLGMRGRIAVFASAMAVVGGGVAVSMGTSFAAENCQALQTAENNNKNFIAQQQQLAAANPGAAAVFQGRIDNRNAVIANIDSRLAAAGCNGGGAAATGGVQAGAGAAAQNAGNGGAVCQGLQTALQNNQNFIAKQQQQAAANPAAASVFQGNIANREAVIANIQSRLAAAGC